MFNIKKPKIIPELLWYNKEGIIIGMTAGIFLAYTPGFNLLPIAVLGIKFDNPTTQHAVIILLFTIIGTLLDVFIAPKK